MRQYLPAIGLLLLAACANETALPEATSVQARNSTAPARPAAPTTRVATFDGRWVGTITLQPDRTRECPRAPSGDREIAVTQGQAVFVLDQQIRQSQSGFVNADGSIRMVDSLDRTIATTGLFADGVFQGEYRNGLCAYAVRMVKRGS
ncbi:hypothetical protein [Belnapia sp. F-4-1]|uniref:hypothetical protein n=1 Tax=Belnapia sp. F-4-1 TaxID=1545443 RepID=UPI0005B9B1DD|nr:hypothetical protein [Belnapia sp. F-4-1]